MQRLHDPTVRPTGRSNRLVQQLDQQLRRVNGRPTDWSNRLDESNMSPTVASLKRSSKCLVGPTVGPIMQIRSPNQPLDSTYNQDASNNVIFSFGSVHRRNLPSLFPCSGVVTTLVIRDQHCRLCWRRLLL